MKEIIITLIKDVNWGILIPALVGLFIAKNPIKEKYKHIQQIKKNQNKENILKRQQERYDFILNDLAENYWCRNKDKTHIHYNINKKYHDDNFKMKQEYDKCWLISNDDIIISLNKVKNNNESYNDKYFGELLLNIRKETFPNTKLTNKDYLINGNFAIKA